MSKKIEYTTFEMMVIAASREIKDGELVFAGIGLPVLATNVAQKLHAKNSGIMFEAGGLLKGGCTVLPLTVDDFGTFVLADATKGMYSSMAAIGRGDTNVAFISGAQVDKYGNVNSTGFGDFSQPNSIKLLPGSGGANPLASLGKRTLIIMPQEKRKFVEKVDYITSPGWLWGPGARESVGLPSECGPAAIISSMGIFRFDDKTKETYLDAIFPKVAVEDVKANTGWDLKVAPDINVITKPTEEELNAVREIDKSRLYYPANNQK
jgi:acyl CoA:acetate/3-ketoacid CoA transferase beta subunit